MLRSRVINDARHVIPLRLTLLKEAALFKSVPMINLTEVVTKSPQSKKNQTINLAILWSAWTASYSIADRLRSFFADSLGGGGKKKEKKKKKKPRRMMRRSLKRCVNRRKENIENQVKPCMRTTHISRNIEEKARQGK